MSGFPLGLIILIVIFILVISELANHILTRIHLKKNETYIILIMTFLGSYINIPFKTVTINLGGTLMPLVISGIIIFRTEIINLKKIIISIAITSLSFYFASLFIGVPFAQVKLIDPLYYTPLIAGVTAFFSGKTLKISFIAAIVGVLLGNILYFTTLSFTGRIVENTIGGGGFFDSIIFAGIIAVLTTEVIGKVKDSINFFR